MWTQRTSTKWKGLLPDSPPALPACLWLSVCTHARQHWTANWMGSSALRLGLCYRGRMGDQMQGESDGGLPTGHPDGTLPTGPQGCSRIRREIFGAFILRHLAVLFNP